MPWKDGYTTSDEKSLADHEVRWPDGKQCACVIVIDLSVASGPAGITPAELTTAASQFGTQVGLPSLLAMLQRFGMTAEQVRAQLRHTTTQTQKHHEKDDLANLRGAMKAVDFEG